MRVIIIYIESFSALQRAEIAEIQTRNRLDVAAHCVSVLFNEPKLLKCRCRCTSTQRTARSFSALQRAEIAETLNFRAQAVRRTCFSALQRAEIAEIFKSPEDVLTYASFSALQRAEIAEMVRRSLAVQVIMRVSVLFNEPTLLKSALLQRGGFRGG